MAANPSTVNAGASTGGGAGSSVEQLTSVAEYDRYVAASVRSPSTAHVVQFTASWHEPSIAMQAVLATLAQQTPNARFAIVDAEALQEVTERYNEVQSVPTFIFLKGGRCVEALEGADSGVLTQKVAQHSRPPLLVAQPVAVPLPAPAPTSAATTADPLSTRLHSLINRSAVMIFIKGTPDAPRCGFSKQLLALLSQHGVQFDYFDILSDSEVREGLKTYSNWPTFPQVYEKGELVGGLDVVKELMEAGEFPSSAAQTGEEPLTVRIRSLLSSHRVLLFMKGDRQQPRCGFSRAAVELLNGEGVEYGTFDILQDEEIRQGVKEYSNWPTYPQLYVKGELVGGLDVMKEMKEGGELSEALKAIP